MQDTKTGGNRWLPDIRPEEIDTYQETNNEETATYKLVDAHPILSRVLDKLAYFRTHAAAVWYNKLAGKSVKDKFDEVDASISSLNSRGLWTPKLYNNTEYIRDLELQDYYKIGDIYILYFYFSNLDINDVDVMLQLRNFPCSWILGGSCYFASLESKTKTIQATNQGIYFRPNIKASDVSNGILAGVSSGVLIGV